MITIHKYPLMITDEQRIQMPDTAAIISAGDQRGILCIWAIVDTEETLGVRTIRIYRTGHKMEQMDSEEMFIGTVLMRYGHLEWHVFEKFEFGTFVKVQEE